MKTTLTINPGMLIPDGFSCLTEKHWMVGKLQISYCMVLCRLLKKITGNDFFCGITIPGMPST